MLQQAVGTGNKLLCKEGNMGNSLKGTKSHENLKHAFAGESQANRRYLYFARRADIEGYPDVGGLFRDTSEAETGHAFGHLDFLKEVGDPATGVAIGNTEANLKSAIEGETYEYTQMYPGMAKTARDEGFAELAEWFETLAKAERSHANRFTKGLDSLKPFLAHGPRHFRLGVVSIMVNRQSHPSRLIGERLNHGRHRTKPHKMDGADFRLVAVPPLKLTVYDVGARPETNCLPMIEAHEQIQPLLHSICVGQFNQKGGAQFARVRNQRIINIQFLLDLLRIHNPFDANHFLDLKPKRLPIFKYERDLVADGDAAPAFQRDDCLTIGVPLPLVFFRRNQFLARQHLHRAIPALIPSRKCP